MSLFGPRTLDYKPPPTIEQFMLDDSFVRVIVGPIGSGKSMGCIMELLRRACAQAPHLGMRNTRFVIVRNTLQQIRATALKDIQEHLSPICNFFVTDNTIRIRTPLPDGTMVNSDWILIPLDSAEDQKRLLSMQLTGGWINELREVPFDIIDPLLGRLRRYPSQANGGQTWSGLVGDTNPWDTESKYHEALVLQPRKHWRLFHQPSAIGPGAENREHLHADYYETLMDGRDEDWAAVHIESQWGTSNAGQAVFRRSFHAATHVRDMEPVVNPMRPIMVGMDFGRTPCALIGQVDNYGRAIIYKEVIAEGMGLPQMIEEHLKPALSVEPFAGRRVFVVGDPAGVAKSQTSEETPFVVLHDQGFLAYPASTNYIEPRLMAVERALRSSIVGEPGLQICREGCPTLISALGNKYRFRKKRDGQLEEVPEKLHPWSDIADALQYFCLGTQANLVGRAIRQSRPRLKTSTGPRSSAGWT